MSRTRSNEEVVELYARASVANDLEELASLRHPDWSVDWPQSGERVGSHSSFAEIIRRNPGGHPTTTVTRIVGSEDRWVVTPGNTVVKVVGAGDAWWSEWLATYPDGQTYHVIDLIELRDGLVRHETVYWAAPFAAPDWRRPFVDDPSSAAPGPREP